jgi:hypothetical protein
MQSIDDILEPYAELEKSVRTLMTELFSDSCGMCTACCCRADICEEATQSAFLSKLLIKQGLAATDMDDRFGWLDLNGCSLEYGKPPICYEYFCDQLLSRLPDDEARYSARILGKLMDFVGKEAVGNWHLVEVMSADDLEKVSIDMLEQRLDDAIIAFEAIEEFMQSGRLSAANREALAVIDKE